MSRFARLLALAVVVLGLTVPYSAGAAQAADPSATTTRLFRTGGPFPRTIDINARARSAAGVPTGTMTFYEVGDPDPIGDPVPVDAQGRATVTVPTPACGPFVGCETNVYRAVFTPTGSFAGSEGTEGDGLPLKVVGDPTILGLGGPSLLKISLTTAATVTYSDGVPAEGAPVTFTYGGNANSADPSKVTQVCFGFTDLHGYLSCKGQGGTAALVSLLNVGTFANVLAPTLELPYYVAKLPVIAVVK